MDRKKVLLVLSLGGVALIGYIFTRIKNRQDILSPSRELLSVNGIPVSSGAVGGANDSMFFGGGSQEQGYLSARQLGWVKYDFVNPQIVQRVDILSRVYDNNYTMPQNITIAVSNDDISYVSFYTGTPKLISGVAKSIILNNAKPYRYIKIMVNSWESNTMYGGLGVKVY